MEAVNSHKPSTARFLKRGSHDRGCLISHEISTINCDQESKSGLRIHTNYADRGMSLTFNKSLPGSIDLGIGFSDVLGLSRLECSIKSSVLVVLKAPRELNLLDF